MLNKTAIAYVMFLLLTTLIVSNAFAEEKAQDVTAWLVNYKQSLKYNIAFGMASFPVLVSNERRVAGPGDVLAKAINFIKVRNKERSEAANQRNGRLPQAAKWVYPSPNGKFLIVGFEDPSVEPMRSAVLLRATDLVPVTVIKAEGRIRDLLWSSNSSTVFLLESKEHISKSLKGLFSAISGHPIPIQTFSIHYIEIQPLREKRTEFLTNFEYGEALFISESAINGVVLR